MKKLVRFGVSLDSELVSGFDKDIREKGYPTRSKAIGDLIRNSLIDKEWKEGKEVAGSITIVYDHHKRELGSKLTNIQHDYQSLIISSQHIHLDHNNCLEIVVVKGKPKDVKNLSEMLKAVKGVKYGTLSMATTGKDIA